MPRLSMKVITSADEVRAMVRTAKAEGRKVGLVPTMGALHQGHLSLVRTARQQCPFVVASVFVNPTQFGPNEDFKSYPRNLERDREMLEAEGVSLLFAPSVEEMYPAGGNTFVTVEGMSDRLCGRSRPGHFRGVTTVVSKLFHIVEPDVAVFGQKDAAQAAIIRRMVHDLKFDVQVVVCPIVREADGLAMSSRNGYLSPAERKQALALFRALSRVQTLADQGEADSGKLIAAAKSVFAEEPAVRLDYVEIVNPETLESVREVSQGALVAVAVFMGKTRLIDNLLVTGVGKARKMA